MVVLKTQVGRQQITLEEKLDFQPIVEDILGKLKNKQELRKSGVWFSFLFV